MKLRFPDSVVFREEPEGGILFDVDTGDMRFVEGVAVGICSLIEGGMTRDGILSELATRYPAIPPGTLETDLDAFLDDLDRSSMLRRI